jgi:TonB family protein
VPFDPTRTLATGALLSLMTHVLLVWLVPAPRPALARTLTFEEVEIDLTLGDGQVAVDGVPLRDTPAAELTPGGADAIQNVDARDRGRGGDGVGPSQVVLLLPRDAPITLTDSPMDAVGASQTQRIETGRERASYEDRRATPSPDDDHFLASGDGAHAERRPLARTDAAEGARVAPVPSTAGAASPQTGEGALLPRAGATARTEAADVADSPGRGIADGSGQRRSESADVAFGRPTVDEGPAATTTEARDRPRDDTDAELLASAASQSMVESTERSGPRDGVGRGGVDHEGPEGSGGGVREGGHALVLGDGRGMFDSLDTSDARYQHWLGALRRRVADGLEFPRARQLAMDQGTSVFRLTVRRDGSIVGAPRLIRSSGYSDLDHAALVALVSALPLDPVPSALAPSQSRVDITIPVEFSNPMVR